MCGLAGRFRVDGLTPANGWANAADARLQHRGPDGAGRFRDWSCELVHRRLAIQDLSPSGEQPMPNEDGTVQLVFNGEIYNHRELRRELQGRGHRFRGTSDTEVIVHLYEEAGEAFVARLRGIFAIALYDARLGRLVLARDRFGVKPLFYSGPSRANEWVFASEMKAIFAHPDFVPRIDRQACYDFLGLGFVPEPATGFLNVAALEPGTLLCVDGDGVRLRRWAEVYAEPVSHSTLADSLDRAEAILLAAVRQQSQADVAVGALLSGGIDSSLVVAARARSHGQPAETFTVGFADRAHDESTAAAAVAEHCATRHHRIETALEPPNADEVLDLLRHFDQPFADASFLPTYWVAKAIRSVGLKCALSGDGGDEAFGGYPRFWQAPRLGALARWPSVVLRAGRATGTVLSRVTRDAGRQLARASQIAHSGRHDSAALIAGLSNYLDESQKASLVEPEARQALLPSDRLFDGYHPNVAPSVEELSRRLTETMFRVTLPSDMLRKVDMMSMRVGLEVRVPMLDDDLVGLGLTLPHRLKSDGKRGKLVLRALARRWLPRDVAALPKKGFSPPRDLFSTPALHDAMRDYLLAPGARTESLLARPLVAEWVDGFADGRAASRRVAAPRARGAVSDGGLLQRVLGVLSLELWMRDYRLTW